MHSRDESGLQIIQNGCSRSRATAIDAEVENIDETSVRPTTRVPRDGDRLLQRP